MSHNCFVIFSVFIVVGLLLDSFNSFILSIFDFDLCGGVLFPFLVEPFLNWLLESLFGISDFVVRLDTQILINLIKSRHDSRVGFPITLIARILKRRQLFTCSACGSLWSCKVWLFFLLFRLLSHFATLLQNIIENFDVKLSVWIVCSIEFYKLIINFSVKANLIAHFLEVWLSAFGIIYQLKLLSTSIRIFFVCIFTSRLSHSGCLFNVTDWLISCLANVVPVWAQLGPHKSILHFLLFHSFLVDLSRLDIRYWHFCIYITHPLRSLLFDDNRWGLCVWGALYENLFWCRFYLCNFSPLLHTNEWSEFINFLNSNIDPFHLLLSLWVKL